MTIGVYFRLNYYRLLTIISGAILFMGISMAILLVNIVGYYIINHWWLLMAILLVTISGYFIGDY